MVEFLREWWPAGAALLTALLGLNTLQARTSNRLDNMERRMEKAEKSVEELERGRTVDAVTLGIIQTTLTQIKESIDGLREEMRGKADKS